MILIGIVSVQFGAGLADRLFGQVPPAAVTGLRLWTSALAMVVISGRGVTRSVRDLKKRRAVADAAIAASFGISLGVMNFSIYQSFARIPLGVAVTIEFLGPLAVAVAGSRHLRDVGWVVLAGAGVVLLTQGGHGDLNLVAVTIEFLGPLAVAVAGSRHLRDVGWVVLAGAGVVLLTQGGHGDLNLAGVLFAGLAAGCWAAYIVLLGVGGVIFPLAKFPAGARPVLELLPTGALSTGLRNVLQQGVAFPVGNAVTLLIWAAVAITLAARTFRWE